MHLPRVFSLQRPLAISFAFGAQQIQGSWWPNYTNWLAPFGGKKVPVKKAFGNTRFKKLEAAPGSYVKEKLTPIA
jgi:polyhydroxyalkanoate synthase